MLFPYIFCKKDKTLVIVNDSFLHPPHECSVFFLQSHSFLPLKSNYNYYLVQEEQRLVTHNTDVPIKSHAGLTLIMLNIQHDTESLS